MTDKTLGTIGLAHRAGKVKFGVFLTLSHIENGKAKLVVAASDIGESNKKSIAAKCAQKGVPLIFLADKKTLGKALGKEETVALAVTDDNFKTAILKIYGGGLND